MCMNVADEYHWHIVYVNVQSINFSWICKHLCLSGYIYLYDNPFQGQKGLHFYESVYYFNTNKSLQPKYNEILN